MRKFLPWILLAGCCPPEKPNGERLPRGDEIFAVEEPSVKTCYPCHKQVYMEWAETLHANAWVNGLYTASTKKHSMPQCLMCHSTLPIFWEELKWGKDDRPKFRGLVMEDGINCLTCHGLPGGGVAASRDVHNAPCQPKKEPRLKSAEFCAVCHNPTHYAYDEWKTSNAAKKGYDCVSCHMAVVERDTPHGKRKGRSHYMPGGFDWDQVNRAVSIEDSYKDRKLSVKLVNNCGHKFPGEVGFRAFVIKVVMYDDKDEEVQKIFTTLRRELKGEVNWVDNSLKPDETRTIEFDIPANIARVETKYFFKQFSVQFEDGAIQLGGKEFKTK
jgi:hypothetical protein